MADVLEIKKELGKLTALPFSPKWLLGIVAHQNDVFSVIDFCRFTQSPSVKERAFIFLQGHGVGFCLEVSEVLGIKYQECNRVALKNWCDGESSFEGHYWQKINIAALVNNPKFLLDEK